MRVVLDINIRNKTERHPPGRMPVRGDDIQLECSWYSQAR